MIPRNGTSLAAVLAAIWVFFTMAGCSQDEGDPPRDGSSAIRDSGGNTDFIAGPGADSGPGGDSGVLSPTATRGSGGSKDRSTASYEGRDYVLYVPQSYSGQTPSAIVVALHGSGDSHVNFYDTLTHAGWVEAADNNNFILLVPDNTNETEETWWRTSGGSLDVAATEAEMKGVLDTVYYGVGASHNIETTEIYWIGFSAGAGFANYAAYLLHNELHAVAPYAGMVQGVNLLFLRKIPIYFICGDQDAEFNDVQSSSDIWKSADHPVETAWIAGVGHNFVELNKSPTPDEVYQWLSTVSCEPVVSGYIRP